MTEYDKLKEEELSKKEITITNIFGIGYGVMALIFLCLIPFLKRIFCGDEPFFIFITITIIWVILYAFFMPKVDRNN